MMRIRGDGMMLAVASTLIFGGTAFAGDVKVTLSKVHICCNGCVKALDKATEKIDGAKVVADKAEKTVAIEAADEKTAQKAVNAIAKAGYHGKSSSKTVKIKDDSGIKARKVKSLKLAGIHNCCGRCAKAITAAVEKLEGVEEVIVKAKSKTVTVKGDFQATAVVKALNGAGFHVKKPKKRKNV